MKDKLVTCIISTYNNAHYICEAIDSILAQTYKRIQIIVVDDGSTDNTAETLKRYGDKIEYYRFDTNKGTSSAKNYGIQKAAGEYISFLDADDIWLPEKTEEQVKFLESHPDYGMCYCDKEFIDKDGLSIPNNTKWSYPSGNIFDLMVSDNYISAPSLVLLRKECFETCGVFEEHPAMRCSQDYNVWIRVAFYYNIGFIDQTLVKYRYHSGGTSRNVDKTYQAKLYNCQRILEQFADKRPHITPLIKNRIFRIHRAYAKTYLYIRNIKEARKASCAALSMRPCSFNMLVLFVATFLTPLFDMRRKIKGRQHAD